MPATNLKVSKNIESFLDFTQEAKSTYSYVLEMFHTCEALQTDISHKLELRMYKDRNERARLHTQLENCLRDRRYYKDRIEELEPFVSLFQSPEGSKINNSCLNNIKQSLGAVRKAEKYHKERAYKPRIVKDFYGEEIPENEKT